MSSSMRTSSFMAIVVCSFSTYLILKFNYHVNHVFVNGLNTDLVRTISSKNIITPISKSSFLFQAQKTKSFTKFTPATYSTTGTCRFVLDKRPEIPFKERRNKKLKEDEKFNTVVDDLNNKRGFWSSLKERFYSTADSISSVSSSLFIDKNDKNDRTKDILKNGYRDKIESQSITSTADRMYNNLVNNRNNDNYGSILLRQFETIQRDPESDLLLRQYEAMQREQNIKQTYQRTSELDYTPSSASSTTRKFDNVKGLLRSTTDKLSSVVSNFQNPKENKTTIPTYKPVFKKSNTNDEFNLQIQLLIPKLSTKNPITRIQTQWKIKRLKQQKEARERALEREATFQKVKTVVYDTIDTTKQISQVVANIPQTVSETAQKTKKLADDTLDFAQSTLETIERTPDNVRRTSQKVNQSIQNGIEIAQVVANDVKNIPQTVQSTIDNTTTSITNSIESVQRFQQNIKVMTGLEPPPPPPPKSGKEIAKEIALDVTGAVVKTAGQSAWYISKKTVALGIYGIKLAWKSRQDDADKKVISETKTLIEETKETIKVIEKLQEDTLMKGEKTNVELEEKIRDDVDAGKLNVVITESTEGKETIVREPDHETTISTSPTSDEVKSPAKPPSSSSSEAKETSTSAKPESEPLQASVNVPEASESKKKSLFSIFGKRKQKQKDLSDIDDALQRAKEATAKALADLEEIESKITFEEEQIRDDVDAEKLNATTVEAPEPETTISTSPTSKKKKSRSIFSFFKKKRSSSSTSESKGTTASSEPKSEPLQELANVPEVSENNEKSLFPFIRKRKQKQKKISKVSTQSDNDEDLSDIDDALKRAKVAAARASADLEAMEIMLDKRKK